MIATVFGLLTASIDASEALLGITIAGIDFELRDLVFGLAKGLTYAALAAGFILIYRSTGVLNFAHAETGALGLAIFVYLLVEQDLNWWLAYAIAIFVGAMTGMVVELIIVRRLFNSPRLVLLIATIGVAQLLQAIKINLPAVRTPGAIPLPFEKTFGDRDSIMILRPRVYVVLVVVPIIILLLGLFLSRTRFGLAVRATASNADTARVYGTSPRITSTIVWTIAGALAVATAVLFAPLDGTPSAQAGTVALAAPLLLRAIVVGLIARMRSLPIALVGGMAVGVIEQLISANVDSANRSVVDLYLFVAVLVVTLVVTRSTKQAEEASWSLSPHLTPVPERLKKVWYIKYLNHIGFGILFGGFGLFGLMVDSSSRLFTWTNNVIFAVIGVSLSLLTGWAGQLSLGHFAFVGLGAMSMVMLTQGNEIPWIGSGFELEWGLALVFSVLIGVVAAMLIGLPALRVKGLFLAVVTLAFAVAATKWLFIQDFMKGEGTATERVIQPVIGPIDFSEGRKSFYFLCLGSLAIICFLLARIRRTGIGRSLIAVRENEDAAAANTVSPSRMKLIGFAVSGGIAAYAGALFITVSGAIVPASTFTPENSLRVVAIAIIGGLGSIAGPILGTLWVEGVPALWGNSPPDLVVLLTSSIGLLVLLMYFPGGIQQLVYKVRDLVISFADSRLGPETTVVERVVVDAVPTRNRGPIDLPAGQPALQTHDVSVRFGGNRAVNDVSFSVMPGELVGLIGTNGAGKSTLLNAISGFVPSTGTIEVLGKEVNGLSAHARHRLGLGRGFQAAKLYPDLNVRETLMVALEARESSRLIPSMLALPPSPASERRKRAEADEIISFLGLGIFADSYVASLSTGTRRIVELGSLLAVDAKVLLLDEPTGGVAQKETEAFGPLIRSIQRELEAAVVVIEHDMPLVMSISDRVYCLEAGEVIAEGLPDEVRSDPLVISSYLGTDDRAIDRSDQTV